jgi:hypothetical protein
MDLPFAQKAQLSEEDATKDATSGLIRRQDAIDAIEKNTYRHTYLDQIIDIIKALPSAQPETPMQIGWICPVCGRGLSPLTGVCPCNNGKGWEITC